MRSPNAPPACAMRRSASMYLTDGDMLRHARVEGTDAGAGRATSMRCRSTATRCPAARCSSARRSRCATCWPQDAEYPLSHEIAQRIGHRTRRRHAALSRRPAVRDDPAAAAGGAALQRARNRAAADLRRPGGDRARERAPVQRDEGSARPAARIRRGPRGHQQLDRRHDSRCSTRSSRAASACSPASVVGINLVGDDGLHSPVARITARAARRSRADLPGSAERDSRRQEPRS